MTAGTTGHRASGSGSSAVSTTELGYETAAGGDTLLVSAPHMGGSATGGDTGLSYETIYGTVPLAVGRGTGATVAVAVAAGCGSPKPGGRIDSGRSCPSAGNAKPAIASPSATLREVRKVDCLLHMRPGPLAGVAGKQEQGADNDDERDDDGDDQAGHGGTLKGQRVAPLARGTAAL